MHREARALTGSLGIALLVSLLPISPALAFEKAAQDLSSLVARYRAGCQQVIATRSGREEKIKESITPVLEKIAALGSDDAFKFLVGELRKGPLPEISAACAAPILTFSGDRAVAAVLGDLPRRPPVIQKAVLEALGSASRDLAGAERDLLALGRSRLPDDVLPALPAVLAKLDSEEAARLLIAQVRPARSARGQADAAAESYEKEVIAALRKTKSESIKAYLATRALSSASQPDQLVVIITLIGELNLADARDDLVKLIGNRSPEVAAAAVSALTKVGVGNATDAIARALERQQGSETLTFRIQSMDALATSGKDDAIDVVIRFARGRDPEMRSIAIGSLALAARHPRALNALLEGLKDEQPAVRSVALRAVSRVREKAMIGPLIDALESDDYSFQVKVLQLLVNLTGQNMGLVPGDWRKWWDIAEARFEFPKSDEKSFTSVRAYDLDYFGIEVSSKRLGFVVDISSSMTEMVKVRRRGERSGGASGGTTVAGGKKGGDEEIKGDRARKIDVLKKELTKVIRKLPPDTFINILTFDATYRAWQKQLQPLAGPGRARALKYVEDIKTGFGTNVFDTLEFALQDKRVDTIYLLTDGLPTRGRITNPDAIVEEIRKQNRLRAVTIHCIAFGEESDLLKRLAADNGGEYRFVDEY
ncbi:MAG: HEAT repeat domain-containing protein [Planctomycetes bacterium]|nr:HEAT repeat domain-containing protein [Planctomycetota bacterium]